MPQRAVDELVLLADGRDVAQRVAGGRFADEARDHPRGEVWRGEAAARGRDVADGVERPVQHLDAGLDAPRLGGEVGARRHAAEQAKAREQQRARALRAEQLARGIAAQLRQQRRIGGEFARAHAAANEHGVRRAGFRQRTLRVHGDAVHRPHRRRRTRQRDAPFRRPDAAEHGQGDQRVELVEAVEGQDGDVHGGRTDGHGARGAREHTNGNARSGHGARPATAVTPARRGAARLHGACGPRACTWSRGALRSQVTRSLREGPAQRL